MAMGTEVGSVVGLFVGRPRAMVGSVAGELVEPAVDLDGGAGSGPWVSAMVKDAIREPLHLGAINFDGDEQADQRVHGGPDKAVCVYPAAHYPTWWAETDWPAHLGPERFGYGAFGENLTVAGLTEDVVCIGDVFRVGLATVEVSQPRSPCWKLGRRWDHPELTARTRDTDRTGWYVRVSETGTVAPDSVLTLLDRPYPEWTITEVNRVKIHDRRDLDAAARLGRCPALAAGWAASLLDRVERARAR